MTYYPAQPSDDALKREDLTVRDVSANADTALHPTDYAVFRDGDEAEGWLLETRQLDEIWREYEEAGRERRPERERRAA